MSLSLSSASLYDTLPSRLLTTSGNATNTLGTDMRHLTTISTSPMDCPPRSRFLAFGKDNKHFTATGSRSPEPQSAEERSINQVINNNRGQWDHLLHEQDSEGCQTPLEEQENSEHTLAPHSEVVHQTPSNETDTEIILPFPKSRDYFSLLMQSAVEAENQFAKAVSDACTDPILERALFLTVSPESESSESSYDSDSSLSGGSAIGADTSPSSSTSAQGDLHDPYEDPIARVESGKTGPLSSMMKQLLALVKANHSHVGNMLARILDGPKYDGQEKLLAASVQEEFLVASAQALDECVPALPTSVTSPELLSTSATDHVETEKLGNQTEPKPADYYVRRAQERIRAQRAAPRRRCREDSEEVPSPIHCERGAENAKNASNNAASFESLPNINISSRPTQGYRGDQNVSWPSPPPTALLRSSIPSPVPFSPPFVFHPTFNVDTVANTTSIWPSPPPLSLLQSDLPQPVRGTSSMWKYYADWNSAHSASSLHGFVNAGYLHNPTFSEGRFAEPWGGAVAISSPTISSPTIIAPKPRKPIAIGLMEAMVLKWEEEANAHA